MAGRAKSKARMGAPGRGDEDKVVTGAPVSSPSRALGGRPRTFTDDELEDALRASHGLLWPAAKLLNVTRGAVAQRVDANADRFGPIIKEMREALVDGAESTLATAVHAGDMQASIYALRTVGRARGYGDRQEITGADGGPLEIDVGAALAAALARLG
jgi:hypothetical protein